MNAPAPPELTPRAIILAIVLAMILAGANAYLGLFAGMTIASAIPAAVVSMAVLKLLGGGHILENNIVATGASAGTSIATGVIFTLPALLILGYWQDFRYSWVLAIAGLALDRFIPEKAPVAGTATEKEKGVAEPRVATSDPTELVAEKFASPPDRSIAVLPLSLIHI